MTIVPETEVRALAGLGASGLLVAGRGAETDEREARDLLDLDRPPSRARADYRIVLSLPGPETRRNDRRYRIAIVGPGYRGVLVSDRTRIPGLVGIADVKPTVEALEAGRRPALRARPSADPERELARLDARLEDARQVRTRAGYLLVLVTVALFALALAARSPLLARASLLAVPLMLATSLVLSLADVSHPATVATGVGLAGAAAPLVALVFRARLALALPLVGLLVLYLVVLSVATDVNSLSAFGPHAESGGRFYGVSNRVETLLLAPALLAAALLPPAAAVAMAVLALLTIGWSRAGADGGGLVVFGAAFLVLALRLRRAPVTARTIAAAGGAALAAALVLVGVDAATGGSSHVTRAVGDGPGALARDFAHRVDHSWHSATSSWHVALYLLIGLAFIAALARIAPHSPVRDALLAALAISLLVNDAPVDVLGYGAVGLCALWSWERLRPAPATYLD